MDQNPGFKQIRSASFKRQLVLIFRICGGVALNVWTRCVVSAFMSQRFVSAVTSTAVPWRSPSTQTILSQLGFVRCSRVALRPRADTGSTSERSNIGVVQPLGEIGTIGRRRRCLRRHAGSPLWAPAKAQVTWVCVKELLNPPRNAITPVMSHSCQDPDVSLDLMSSSPPVRPSRRVNSATFVFNTPPTAENGQ